MMKVYYCTDHDGYYPVGTASIIVAENEDDANRMLVRTLNNIGLKGNDPFTLTELDTTKPQVTILQDGNY